MSGDFALSVCVPLASVGLLPNTSAFPEGSANAFGFGRDSGMVLEVHVEVAGS